MPEDSPPLPGAAAPPPGPTGTPIMVPSWVKGVLKYVVIVAPLLFGFWLAMHDLQRDFAKEQEKVDTLKARIVVLEEKDHAKDLVSTKMTTDLT